MFLSWSYKQIQIILIEILHIYQPKNVGGKISFNWGKRKKVTVDTLMRFNNVDTDYVITLKCIVK